MTALVMMSNFEWGISTGLLLGLTVGIYFGRMIGR